MIFDVYLPVNIQFKPWLFTPPSVDHFPRDMACSHPMGSLPGIMSNCDVSDVDHIDACATKLMILRSTVRTYCPLAPRCVQDIPANDGYQLNELRGIKPLRQLLWALPLGFFDSRVVSFHQPCIYVYILFFIY